MTGYPVHLARLEGRRVLLAGGGRVAAGKISALLDAGASVHVVAERFEPPIERFLPLVRAEERRVEPRDLDGAYLAILATDDRDTNRRLAEHARSLGVLVNTVDDASACDFYAPAIVRRGDVTLSVSTDGNAPLVAGQIRRLLEAILPASLGGATAVVSALRKRVRLGGDVIRGLGDPRIRRLIDRRETERAADLLESIAGRPEEPFPPGTVAIAGAGPGSRELLTLRALDRLQRADVVLHDALIDREILDLAMPDARIMDVGKRGGAGCAAKKFNQRLAEQIMIDEARAGARVVRLHAGDPLVFGRGGEEIDALAAAGIPFEIVPGVTSVVASAAAAGVPLTRRGEARGFSVRTGHDADGYTRGELPPEAETAVVLMGLGAVRQIMEGMMDEGRSADLPAMAVSRASLAGEQKVVATVGTLADAVEAAGLETPATLIIGEVVRRAVSAGAAGCAA
jgi:uroporphyrin-III C-methyltransferase/precorrin-2 dehydrogenase/sirohydrochlorin ferrochelatase